MWKFLVNFILRYRPIHLIVIGLGTLFMAYQASQVQLSYDVISMLPTNDPDNKVYEEFKERFGQDGSTMYVFIKNDDILKLETFNQWYDLTQRLNNLEGVYEAVSLARMFELYKDTLTHKFAYRPVFTRKPQTQAELDSIMSHVASLPIYDGLLYSNDLKTTLIAITLDRELVFKKERNKVTYDVQDEVNIFTEKTGIEVHLSGLPYIRTINQKTIQNELMMFVILAMFIAGLALFAFFRSFKATVFPMLIVAIALIWVLGTIKLLGYKITILTGIIPPLMIIIGVENCIFLLNKYHQEFRGHKNKIKALSRVIERVGNAIFLTNLTTAIGFATFIVTRNDILVEFGVVAAINIIILFILAIFLIPIFYSLLPVPKTRHIKHLDNKLTIKIIDTIVNIVINHRKKVYIVTIIAVVAGIFGFSLLKTTGNFIDDLPRTNKIYQDMTFMEKEFQGMLPFEISIDTKKPRGVMRLETIRKIDQLQDTLATYPEFSKPMSIAEVVKFAHQAFYASESKSFYTVPSNRTMTFMMSWMPKFNSDSNQVFRSYVDPDLQITRISARMKNIGTQDIRRIKEDIGPKIDAIFNPGLEIKRKAILSLDTIPKFGWNERRKTSKVIEELFSVAANETVDVDSLLTANESMLPPSVFSYLTENSYQISRTQDYDIRLTGVSLVFLKGSAYLVKNLRTSLLLAIGLIAFIMALLFSSWRMVTVTMIPNLLPLLMTAAMMGFLGVPIKPSTVLIFSIALGISVDNAIHFLSRYRLQLKHSSWDIQQSVIHALKETGFGIIYSSSVLLLGFGIFVLSKFGGTQALGYLVSFTLLVAVASNLIFLPSLILSLDKLLTTKSFKEPMLVILEEEDDIELSELRIEGEEEPSNHEDRDEDNSSPDASKSTQ